MEPPQDPHKQSPDLDTSSPSMPAAVQHAPEPVRAVLHALASGAAYPETALARALDVPVTAVPGRLAACRAAGIEVDARDGWVRLPRPVEWLDPAAVIAALPVDVRRRVGTVENHWRIDSTSSECRRRVRDLPDCSFVFADWQDAGRGRRGRQWVSPPAANLQVSCFKRFAEGFAAQVGLSLAAGVAVAEALDACGVVGVQLKWPNDLVHGDAKLGGVLVELGGDAAGPCHAVIGVGINMHMSAASRRALGRPCSDVGSLPGGATVTRTALAGALVTRMVRALDTFALQGFAAFASAWAARDALANHAIRVIRPGGVFEGVATGVDAHGALRVRGADGLRSIDSADVSVRPA